MTAIYAISIKNKNKNYFYCGMRAQNSQAYASFSPYVCIYYLCKTIDDAKKEINHINLLEQEIPFLKVGDELLL